MLPVSNSESRIKVLVADTIAMSCHLLADALQRSGSYEAVAATTPKSVLQLLSQGGFQVVLIGTGLSDDPLQSIHFLRQVMSLHPGLTIIVLLDAMDRMLVIEAFRAGARGIFSRADSFESLCKCIRCVRSGEVWASSAELQFVLEELVEHGPILAGASDLRPLSKREQQITTLVAEGYSNRQISERLDLSEHTVKNYLFRVFEKLGVSTRVGLTLYALKQNKGSRDKFPSAQPPLLPGLLLVPDKAPDPSSN